MQGTTVQRWQVAGMRHQPWWPGRFEFTVVKPSSGAEIAVVEDEEATPRGSAEGAGSRAAAGVATALGSVAVAKTKADGR